MTLAAALAVVADLDAPPARQRAAWVAVDAALAEAWARWTTRQVGGGIDVDDVRQIVMEKLLTRRACFEGASEAEARGFLRVLVYRAAVDLRRKRPPEVQLLDADLGRTPGGDAPTRAMVQRDLEIRVAELVDRAARIFTRADPADLRRHLLESLVSRPYAQPGPDTDKRTAQNLRKQRARAHERLRAAQTAVLDEAPPDRPDDLDRLLAQVIAPRRRSRPDPDPDDPEDVQDQDLPEPPGT